MPSEKINQAEIDALLLKQKKLGKRISKLKQQSDTLSNAKQNFLTNVNAIIEDYQKRINDNSIELSLDFNYLHEANSFIDEALLIAESDENTNKVEQINEFRFKYFFATMTLEKSLNALEKAYKNVSQKSAGKAKESVSLGDDTEMPRLSKQEPGSKVASRRRKSERKTTQAKSQSSQENMNTSQLNQRSSPKDKENFLLAVLDSPYTQLMKKTTNDSTNGEVKGYQLSMEESDFMKFRDIFPDFRDGHHDDDKVDGKTIWNIIAEPFEKFIQNLREQLPENSEAIQQLQAMYKSNEDANNPAKSTRMLSPEKKRRNSSSVSSGEDYAKLKSLANENNSTKIIKPSGLLSNDKNRNTLLEKLKAHTTKQKKPWETDPKDLAHVTETCDQITVITSKNKDRALETGFVINDDGITLPKNTPKDKVQGSYKKAAKLIGECGFQLIEITAPLNNEASLLAATKSIIAAGQVPVISPSGKSKATFDMQAKIISQLTDEEKERYNAAKNKLTENNKRAFEQKINQNYSHISKKLSNVVPPEQNTAPSQQDTPSKLKKITTKTGHTIIDIKPMFKMQINSDQKTFNILKHSVFGATKKKITLDVKQSVENYLLAKALVEANCKVGNEGDLEVAKALVTSDDIKKTLERKGKISWYKKLNANEVYSSENIKEAMALALNEKSNAEFKNELIAADINVTFADIEKASTKNNAKRFTMFHHADGHYEQNERTKKVSAALHDLRVELVNAAQNENSPARP